MPINLFGRGPCCVQPRRSSVLGEKSLLMNYPRIRIIITIRRTGIFVKIMAVTLVSILIIPYTALAFTYTYSQLANISSWNRKSYEPFLILDGSETATYTWRRKHAREYENLTRESLCMRVVQVKFSEHQVQKCKDVISEFKATITSESLSLSLPLWTTTTFLFQLIRKRARA